MNLQFSLDDLRLFSLGYDGLTVEWDLRADNWKSMACRIANRNLTWQEWQLYLPGRPYELTCPNLPPHPSAVEAGLWSEGVNQE
jgi:hypothetical protein